MSIDSFFRRGLVATVFAAALSLSSLASADNVYDAARNGDLPLLQSLVKADPSLISSKDQNLDTPLICAAEYGHRNVVEWFLLNGADIEGSDYNHSTALHWAAAKGFRDVVELLLQHGANVNAIREDDITPLIWTTNKEVAELLVEHGADVNAEDEDDRTPLLVAEASHDSGWVNFLLAHGARVELFTSPFLWLKIHDLWVMAIVGPAAIVWIWYFWHHAKAPRPPGRFASCAGSASIWREAL